MKRYKERYKGLLVFVLMFVSILFLAPANAEAATVGQQLTQPESGWARYDDTDNKILYIGENWLESTNRDDLYGRSGRYIPSGLTTEKVKSNYIKFKFIGTKFRYIGSLAVDHSKQIGIKIDGVVTSICSEYTTVTPNPQQILIGEILGLTNTMHEVEIISTDGIRFSIDAIDIDDSGYLVDPNTPNSPTNLHATSGSSSIDLTWDAVTGATSYNIYKSQNPDTGYEKIGSTTDTFYQDKDVKAGINYFYKVTAVQSGVESAFSDKASGILGNSSGITGNRAILEITFINGKEKEYDLSASEIDAFINWYDGKSGGTGKSYFAIRKNSNVKPFLGRKEYIRFDTIESFEIKDYNDN